MFDFKDRDPFSISENVRVYEGFMAKKSTFCSYLRFQNNTTNYETHVLKLKDVHYITFTILIVTKNPSNEILGNEQQVTSRSLVNLY